MLTFKLKLQAFLRIFRSIYTYLWNIISANTHKPLTGKWMWHGILCIQKIGLLNGNKQNQWDKMGFSMNYREYEIALKFPAIVWFFWIFCWPWFCSEMKMVNKPFTEQNAAIKGDKVIYFEAWPCNTLFSYEFSETATAKMYRRERWLGIPILF